MQSSSRGGASVRLLAIHTTEGIMRAEDLRAWKSWPGSSHASADQFGNLLDGAADGFVDYSRASWTLRSGNAVSDNIELCAQAKWTRSDWLLRPKILEGAAVWLARRKKARPHIPLVKLSPLQVKAGMSGVIGHVDWTQGMKDGSHWDPGPGFPWDVVLARANQLVSGTGSPAGSIPAAPVQEEEDMTPDQAKKLDETHWMLSQIKPQTDRVSAVQSKVDELHWGVLDPEQGVRIQLAGIFARVGQGSGTGITPADIAAMIPADFATQVADELHKRLAG